MKTKTKIIFVCQSCGAQSPKWQGRCPDCSAWNSFVEEDVIPEGGKAPVSILQQPPQLLKDVTFTHEARFSTDINELNRVLGGGIVAGSLVLIGGNPGIGKSTLALQMSTHLSTKARVLYVSAEESAQQTKLRAARIEAALESKLYIANLTDVESIFEAIKKVKAQFVIIDSIQVIYTQRVSSSPGSVSQVRESANLLMQLAKQHGISIFIIGHVTKEGTIAGPRVLEHMVDTVLYFEGDRFATYRLLRAVKNRFGSTNEVGVFEMSDRGLSEVSNPSAYFLSERSSSSSGSVIGVPMEGTRPLLVELQALVCKAGFGTVRRKAQGVDQNRVNLLVAVLEKRTGFRLEDKDIFVNVVGGIYVDDPAVDVAVAVAIASSLYDKPMSKDIIVLGEVGLGGEIRSVSQLALRLKEAAKLGFTKAIIPRRSKSQLRPIEGIAFTAVATLREVFESLWPKSTPK